MAVKYFLVIEGTPRGPYRLEELEGQPLRRDTLVWYKGLPDWVPAGQVPELLGIFEEPPPLPGNERSAIPRDERPPFPEREPPAAGDQIKDPALILPRVEVPTRTYMDDLPDLPPNLRVARIPYDAVGMRRLYLGGMWAFVPGVVLILGFLVGLALLGIYGVDHRRPRYDPQRREVVFDFNPAARNLETLCVVLDVSTAILGVICVVSGIVCFCVLLYRAWAVIQEGRTTTPGRAVGLLFIPFFNTYWGWVAFWGLACALNRFVRRHELDAPTASQALGFTLSLYLCLMYLPVPFVGFGFLGLILALLPLFMRSVYRTVAAICSEANRERLAHVPLGPSLRQPTLPRPVSAHILAIIATALTPIGLGLLVVGFCASLDSMRRMQRDVQMNDVNREAVAHLRHLGALNPQEQNRLRTFESAVATWEQQTSFRRRDDMIITGAALAGGVLLLAITVVLGFVARACARSSDESGPHLPPAWPTTQGAGLRAKNA